MRTPRTLQGSATGQGRTLPPCQSCERWSAVVTGPSPIPPVRPGGTCPKPSLVRSPARRHGRSRLVARILPRPSIRAPTRSPHPRLVSPSSGSPSAVRHSVGPCQAPHSVQFQSVRSAETVAHELPATAASHVEPAAGHGGDASVFSAQFFRRRGVRGVSPGAGADVGMRAVVMTVWCRTYLIVHVCCAGGRRVSLSGPRRPGGA